MSPLDAIRDVARRAEPLLKAIDAADGITFGDLRRIVDLLDGAEVLITGIDSYCPPDVKTEIAAWCVQFDEER